MAFAMFGAKPVKDKKRPNKFNDKEYDASKRQRPFLPSWTKDFPWLKYDDDRQVMYCAPCRRYPQLADATSRLVTGTDNFRKDPLYKHAKSNNHVAVLNKERRDEEKKANLSTNVCNTPMGRGILAMQAKHVDRLKRLFNTAYGVAKKCRPFTDYTMSCEIQKKNGVDLGTNYFTDKSAQQFTSTIAKTITDEMNKQLYATRYFSVLADGSTDFTIQEQEVIYVRPWRS